MTCRRARHSDKRGAEPLQSEMDAKDAAPDPLSANPIPEANHEVRPGMEQRKFKSHVLSCITLLRI